MASMHITTTELSKITGKDRSTLVRRAAARGIVPKRVGQMLWWSPAQVRAMTKPAKLGRPRKQE